MSRNLIIAIVFVTIGLVVGLNFQQSQSELVISPLATKSNNALFTLNEANSVLSSRISALETQQSLDKLAQQSLKNAIEELQLKLFNQEKGSSPHVINSNTNDTEISSTFPSATISTDNTDDSKTETLLALGIDATITDRIQEREEKMEMDRLYLRNSAIREGWFGTEKYFEKTQGLSNSSNVYREELGDEDYDAYLFNSNQSNRISVLSVISSSPAETAGIKKGDIISQYDNENIFSWSDLTQATTDGEAGQQVSIIIKRNAEEIEFFVPRGPLGIRLENIKRNPQT